MKIQHTQHHNEFRDAVTRRAVEPVRTANDVSAATVSQESANHAAIAIGKAVAPAPARQADPSFPETRVFDKNDDGKLDAQDVATQHHILAAKETGIARQVVVENYNAAEAAAAHGAELTEA